MRLIDADALQAIFNEVSTSLLSKGELSKDHEHMVRAFLMTTEMIKDASTVDAVPVVRCKDCKWSKPDIILNKRWCCRFSGRMEILEDDFCSYGRRAEKSSL